MAEDDKPKRNNRLTERGGVALVCFHLARLGHEYAVTEQACTFGDIWAQIGRRKIGIEVKTTRKGASWHVRRSQVGAVDFYCFVRLDIGHCFILTMKEVTAALDTCDNIHEGVAHLPDTALPSDSFNGWHRLGIDMSRHYKVANPVAKGRARLRAQTVQRVLANGETKTYVYPATKLAFL